MKKRFWGPPLAEIRNVVMEKAVKDSETPASLITPKTHHYSLKKKRNLIEQKDIVGWPGTIMFHKSWTYIHFHKAVPHLKVQYLRLSWLS